MNRDLENRLLEAHPQIFQHFISIPVGDGWFDLLDGLCTMLQQETTAGGPQAVARDVKEKYGTPHFSTDGVNHAQLGMIQLAEEMSSRICEVCGTPGQVRRQGWIRTRCDAHVEEP